MHTMQSKMKLINVLIVIFIWDVTNLTVSSHNFARTFSASEGFRWPVALLPNRKRKTTTLIHYGRVTTKQRDLQSRVLSSTLRTEMNISSIGAIT